MQADARLPDDIRPATAVQQDPTCALVTGATGFLGRHAVQALLRETKLHLICLVRDGDGVSARQRLLDALADIGVNSEVLLARITVVVGDIALERFGLPAEQYNRLAQDIGRIYHCAAHVNWARNYRQLRDINVCGALEVIRFASLETSKPIVFVSTIAVCFAIGHDVSVTEETDMLAQVERMPLGYAQSKCVAESLMRQASERGLPVTILRPSLISGDSRNGKANPDDLIAALIEGCARAGVCGDSDWLLDCVPVNMVAEVIARVPVAEAGKPVIVHLVHDKPCHWREAIACLNGFGCPVKLVSIDEWTRIVFADRQSAGVHLYGYRRFFKGFAGLQAPFETYLQRHQQRIDSNFSYQMLGAMGISIPALDQSLLIQYLNYYDGRGLLPARNVEIEIA